MIGTPVAFGSSVSAYRRAPDRRAAVTALIIASLELIGLLLAVISVLFLA